MQIDVRHDLEDLKRTLSNQQKEQVPYATSLAINACLKKSQQAVKSEMQRVFDRPTPYTLNSYVVMKGARKNSLFGIIGFKTQRIFDASGQFTGSFTSFEEEVNNPRMASTYLRPQMQGGPRPAKGLENLLRARGLLSANEFLVPSRFQKLDQYGNVSRGTIAKIVANLQAARDIYSRTPSGGARGGKKKAEYFFTRAGVRGQRLTAIWQSFGARGNHNAIPAFIVVSSSPKYKKRFDQMIVVQRIVQQNFALEFNNAMQIALATAR